ncbi:MAG: sulfur carrier protein ThiS [Synechococcaceae cyanobacterium]|nr:sulfur carrier protein ThiS [Synechococcaceae cyanobacterium]
MSAAQPTHPASGPTPPESTQARGAVTPEPAPSPQVTVRLNGEVQRVPAGLDLDALLRHLGHQPQLVVVEYNGVILPRALWADQRVGESDVIEVVTIVGGGS